MRAINNRRPRAGIFGVGRMGVVHLENLARVARDGGIELAAIGDRHRPTLERAQRTLRKWLPAASPALFESPEAMATDGALDACVIASRTEDHARDALALAGHGIRVLVEKPMAQTMDEAAALVAGLGERDDHVQIAFQRHYDPAARAAIKWVGEGRIGSLQQSHHVLQDKNPTPPAYQSAGITADMAIHLIFEAMSFHDFALPEYVQALRFLAPHYDDRANERANVVHAFLQWHDGSIAHLWGSRINNTGYDNGFRLIGTEGRIDVGEFVGNFGPVHARLWTGTRNDAPRGVLAESLTFDMTPTTPDHPDFHARFAAAYAGELDAFLDAVRNGEPSEPGIDIGWKTMLVADLAEQSSRDDGRRFRLAMPDGTPIGTAADAAAFMAGVPATELTHPQITRHPIRR